MKKFPKSNLEIDLPGDLSWRVWKGAEGSSEIHSIYRIFPQLQHKTDKMSSLLAMCGGKTALYSRSELVTKSSILLWSAFKSVKTLGTISGGINKNDDIQAENFVNPLDFIDLMMFLVPSDIIVVGAVLFLVPKTMTTASVPLTVLSTSS
jgi:hypothetical protein